jgi:tRNA A58 N-methylase Trm61
LAAASKGANIAVHYLGSEEAAPQTAEDIREYDMKAIVVKADIAKISDVRDAGTGSLSHFSWDN